MPDRLDSGSIAAGSCSSSPHFRARCSIVTGRLMDDTNSPVVSGLFRFDGRRAGFGTVRTPSDP